MALTKITTDIIADGAITSAKLGSGAVSASSLSSITTDNVSEGSTNVYYTDTRARGSVSVTGGNLSYDSGTGVIQLTTDTIRGAISVTDAGGDGSLAYSAGVITYTGPSAAETRAHFSGSTGVSYNSSTGAFTTSAIPNASLSNSSITINSNSVDLGASVTLDTDDIGEGSTNLYYTDARVGTYISGNRTYGNITTTGYIAGPATFTIDPAAVGDNTGTVVIAGNLQVDGTTTTINSTTMTVDDLNITLASGAANAAAANGAGITVDTAGASIIYDATNDEWDFNKDINVTGTVTSSNNIKVSSGSNEVLLNSDGSVEITRAAGGPYIDFKDNTSDDYDQRLQINSGNFNFSSALQVAGSTFIDTSRNITIGTGTISSGAITTTTNGSGYALIIEENSGGEQYQIGTDVYGGLNFFNSGTKIAEFTDTGEFQLLDGGSPNVVEAKISPIGDSYFTGGDVGIGTNNPLDKLHVLDGDIGIQNTSGKRYRLIAESDGGFTIRDQNAAQNRIHIDTSGDVGIGTSSPSKRLDIRGGDVTIYGGADGYDANGERVRLYIGDNNAHIGAEYGTGLFVYPGNSGGETIFHQATGSVNVGGDRFVVGSALTGVTRLDTTADDLAFYYGASNNPRLTLGRDQYQSGQAGIVMYDPSYAKNAGAVGIGCIGQGIMGFSTSDGTNFLHRLTIDNAGRLKTNIEGNINGGNLQLGENTTSTVKTRWSLLTGAHYNGTSSPKGVTMIACSSDLTYGSTVIVGGGPYEGHASTRIEFNTDTSTTHPTGGNVRMTILGNGNVGIGVRDPDVLFEVAGSARFANENHAWTFDDTLNNRAGFIKKGGSSPVIAHASGTELAFVTSNATNLQSGVSSQVHTTRLKLNTNGYVEIPLDSGLTLNGDSTRISLANTNYGRYRINAQGGGTSGGTAYLGRKAATSYASNASVAEMWSVEPAWAKGAMAYKRSGPGYDVGEFQWWLNANVSNGEVNSTDDKMRLNYNGSLSINGGLTQNASDERMKENIAVIPDALNKITQLRGVSFTWKDGIDNSPHESGKEDIGVIAQDVEAVLPLIVKPAPFDTVTYHDEDNDFEKVIESKSGEHYKTVEYEKLIPLLIEGIKELKTENDNLKARIETLENP